MKLKPLKFKTVEELEKTVNRSELFKEYFLKKDDGHCLIQLFKDHYDRLAKIDKGDQESLYLNYFKLFLIKDKIYASRLYKDDSKFITLMISEERFSDVNNKVSQLKASLKDRYEKERNDLNFNKINFNDSSPYDYLNCKQLFDLINEQSANKSKLLLIDIRSKDDFNKSSIVNAKHQFQNPLITLNLPEDRIVNVLTCSDIESLLNPFELNLFRDRNKMHTVVLMDYDSSSLNSNEKLSVLFSALTKVSKLCYLYRTYDLYR